MCMYHQTMPSHSTKYTDNAIYVRAQVDTEELLRHQVLLHHVLEDRHHLVSSKGLEGKSQDTIRLHVGHEGSLGLTEPKHLVGHRNSTNLEDEVNS